MAQTCILCHEDFVNPYEGLCAQNFRRVNSQVCRFYICADCTGNSRLLENGCPICHDKGMPKFVPPGFKDLVMESKPEPRPVTAHVPNLGGVTVDAPDFSEHPAIVLGKRRVQQTDFYQPEQQPNRKAVARFPRCEMCRNDTSVRFCDAISCFKCVPCRQRGHECLKGFNVMPLPPQSIGEYPNTLFKKNRKLTVYFKKKTVAPAPPAPPAPPLPAMLAAPAILLPPNAAPAAPAPVGGPFAVFINLVVPAPGMIP